MIDFPIERINRFFDNHIFEVYLQPTHDEDYSIRTNVKIKLTGVKDYISMGDKKPHVEYTIYILPTDETSDTWNNLYADIYGRNTSINTSSQEYANLRWIMNKKLEDFLQYFGVNKNVICTKVINEVEPKKMNESLITEARYDNVVRTLVKDIISLYKFQREGEFSLPEDIKGEEYTTYNFPEFENEFSIELNLATDDDVETVEIDAAYYRDEDVIEVTIVSNPEIGLHNVQELIGELNETIRHELEHVSQHQKGYDFPKEPKNPFKYYTQPYELEAQLAGFKRRARKENRDLEEVIRGWFRRNEKKHRLKPKQVEILIKKLLEMST
jgi:hypothetical protein